MERRTFLRTGFAAGAATIAPVPLQGMSWLFDPRHAQDGTIRLSSNENPLGLAPVARQAVLDGREEANRYPGASRRALLDVLAPYLDVPEDRLFFGAG